MYTEIILHMQTLCNHQKYSPVTPTFLVTCHLSRYMHYVWWNLLHKNWSNYLFSNSGPTSSPPIVQIIKKIYITWNTETVSAHYTYVSECKHARRISCCILQSVIPPFRFSTTPQYCQSEGFYLMTMPIAKVIQRRWLMTEMSVTHWWYYTNGGGLILTDLSASLCSPQILHGLAWDRTMSSTVRGRQLIARVMVWPTA
jgi:hypothetical protein